MYSSLACYKLNVLSSHKLTMAKLQTRHSPLVGALRISLGLLVHALGARLCVRSVCVWRVCLLAADLPVCRCVCVCVWRVCLLAATDLPVCRCMCVARMFGGSNESCVVCSPLAFLLKLVHISSHAWCKLDGRTAGAPQNERGRVWQME